MMKYWIAEEMMQMEKSNREDVFIIKMHAHTHTHTHTHKHIPTIHTQARATLSTDMITHSYLH